MWLLGLMIFQWVEEMCVFKGPCGLYQTLFHLMMRRFGQWLACLPGSQSDYIEQTSLFDSERTWVWLKINLCCLKLLRFGDCYASLSWLEARGLVGCYETLLVTLSLWYHLLISVVLWVSQAPSSNISPSKDSLRMSSCPMCWWYCKVLWLNKEEYWAKQEEAIAFTARLRSGFHMLMCSELLGRGSGIAVEWIFVSPQIHMLKL